MLHRPLEALLIPQKSHGKSKKRGQSIPRPRTMFPMDIFPKILTKRRPRRHRPGIRSSLILMLLILIVLLISWIFGFRPPQDSGSATSRSPDSTTFSKTSFPGQVTQATKPIRNLQEIEAPPVPHQHPASIHIDPELKESHANSGVWEFGIGPTWISGTLPANLAHEEFASFALVSALGIEDEGLSKAQDLRLVDGRFSFRTPCRLSFVYLKVETKERIDLYGPYTFPPWQHQELGRLPENDTRPWQAISQANQVQARYDVVAIPRPKKGLFPTAIVRQSTISAESNQLVNGPTIRSMNGTPISKKLGGPWDFFLQGDRGKFLPWEKRAQVNNPPTRIRLINLTQEDEVVFLPFNEEKGVLLSIPPGSPFISLPQPLSAQDTLAYARYGSRLTSLSVSDKAEAAITLSMPTSVVFPKKSLSSFTLVEHGTSTPERERIIFRNQLLFHRDHLLHVSIDPMDSSTIDRVRLLMNPGSYDLVQVQGTLSGSIETIRTIEIPPAKDDFLITTLGPIHRRQFIGHIKDEISKEPIVGAGIQLRMPLPGSSDSSWLALSDKNGKFVLSGLPPGRLSFRAHSPSHQIRDFDATLPSFGNASEVVTVFMKPSPRFSITVSEDNAGHPVIDGMVLVREDGYTRSAPAKDGRVSFGALKESSYVALPYMGSPSIPTDDWGWLCEESGGLLVKHDHQTSAKPHHWQSPSPITVKFLIRASHPPQGPMDLTIVHCGQAPFPGIWPNHHYARVPLGVVKLDRILPGNYRAIATIAGLSDILDITIPREGSSVIPLNFAFPKE